MTYGDCVAYLYPISKGYRHVSDDGKTRLTADSRIQNITSILRDKSPPSKLAERFNRPTDDSIEVSFDSDEFELRRVSFDEHVKGISEAILGNA